MDEDTAKEVEDLQNTLKDLVTRKRKREATLEHENEQLKDEDQKLRTTIEQLESDYRTTKEMLRPLRQRLTSSAQKCTQAYMELTEIKRRNDELDTDNKRLKNERAEQTLLVDFLEHCKEISEEGATKQTEAMNAHAEENRLLAVKNQGLQNEVDKLQQYKVASKKAVSNSREKLRLAIDAEFNRLVSYHIKSLEVM
ncbi:hypothetical protein M436DRAFT_82946 [Aureobasidium namibiae CBS 147.97]|uniref:Uncharacterized protein n=1 Tax=Aureobasidium namibiae CBS 147.97 TaxID=1043004 RepID=A0A074XBM8_9PEZI